jgi:hypothetical protein
MALLSEREWAQERLSTVALGSSCCCWHSQIKQKIVGLESLDDLLLFRLIRSRKSFFTTPPPFFLDFFAAVDEGLVGHGDEERPG